MKKSDLPFMPNFFDRYIKLVDDDIDLIDALEKYAVKNIFDLDKLKALGEKVYAENKWTARDIIQHLIDTERILAYRALRFSRNDQIKLPGFEENDYAKEAKAVRRTLDDLFEEAEIVRKSSLKMFRNLDDEMLLRVGVSNEQKISVLALGFVVAGHPVHHNKIVEERYYPLLG